MYRLALVDHTDPDIADDIADLDRAVFNDGSPNLDPETIAVGRRVWWLAFHSGEPVGYCALDFGETPGFGYMARAGVLVNHRGNRLQPRMIRARERKARLLGLTNMVTDTAYFNVRSSNNLIRAGYQLYKPEKPWSFDTSLYWKKKL